MGFGRFQWEFYVWWKHQHLAVEVPEKVTSQAIWTKKTSRNATATWHLIYPEIRSFSCFFSCFSCFFPGSWLVPTLAAFALAACTWIARQNQAPEKSEKGKVLRKCRSHPWHHIFFTLLLEVMSRMGPMDCTSAGKKMGPFSNDLPSELNYALGNYLTFLTSVETKTHHTQFPEPNSFFSSRYVLSIQNSSWSKGLQQDIGHPPLKASTYWVLSSQSQKAQHPSVGRCPGFRLS